MMAALACLGTALVIGSCMLPLDDYDPRLGGGATSAGGQGGTGGHGGSGGTVECTAPEQCAGDDTTCRFRACDGGTCSMTNAAHGTPCTEDGGDLCDGEGACVVAGGEPCQNPSECSSGHCVDGVCCESACSGTCEACVEVKTGVANGACAPIPALADPDGECATPQIGCDGDRGCADCGFAPPSVGPCPGACDSCDGDVCVFDCSGVDACRDGTITCPVGHHCRADCTGQDACRDAVINCPNDHSCQVVCPDAGHRCQNMIVNCSNSGPCLMTCEGSDTCRDAEVVCGDNACTATCVGGYAPNLTCGTSCACTPCP